MIQMTVIQINLVNNNITVIFIKDKKDKKDKKDRVKYFNLG
jgi:hypothetical protein